LIFCFKSVYAVGEMVKTITGKELQAVLMDPKSLSVKEPYFVVKGENGENITIISSGKNGLEFNKTYGYFHDFAGVIIYHCLYGQGILLMQRNDNQGEVKEVRVVGLRPGSVVEVPAGYGHTIANIGKNFLIVADNAPQSEKPQANEFIKVKKGLAYYIVDKKGNVSFEENKNYSFHPQISTN
jgi:oxalate decarboxylase/phosphoglucose isomerase-like protein (cupin superfamily)